MHKLTQRHPQHMTTVLIVSIQAASPHNYPTYNQSGRIHIFALEFFKMHHQFHQWTNRADATSFLEHGYCNLEHCNGARGIGRAMVLIIVLLVSHEVRMLSKISCEAGLKANGSWVWLVAWGGVLFDFQSHIIVANLRRCSLDN